MKKALVVATLGAILTGCGGGGGSGGGSISTPNMSGFPAGPTFNVRVGKVDSQTFTLKNVGTQTALIPSNGISLSKMSGSANLTITNNTCARQKIAVGQSCSFSLTYAPTEGQTPKTTAQLNLIANNANNSSESSGTQTEQSSVSAKTTYNTLQMSQPEQTVYSLNALDPSNASNKVTGINLLLTFTPGDTEGGPLTLDANSFSAMGATFVGGTFPGLGGTCEADTNVPSTGCTVNVHVPNILPAELASSQAVSFSYAYNNGSSSATGASLFIQGLTRQSAVMVGDSGASVPTFYWQTAQDTQDKVYDPSNKQFAGWHTIKPDMPSSYSGGTISASQLINLLDYNSAANTQFAVEFATVKNGESQLWHYGPSEALFGNQAVPRIPSNVSGYPIPGTINKIRSDYSLLQFLTAFSTDSSAYVYEGYPNVSDPAYLHEAQLPSGYVFKSMATNISTEGLDVPTVLYVLAQNGSGTLAVLSCPVDADNPSQSVTCGSSPIATVVNTPNYSLKLKYMNPYLVAYGAEQGGLGNTGYIWVENLNTGSSSIQSTNSGLGTSVVDVALRLNTLVAISRNTTGTDSVITTMDVSQGSLTPKTLATISGATPQAIAFSRVLLPGYPLYAMVDKNGKSVVYTVDSEGKMADVSSSSLSSLQSVINGMMLP